MHLRGFVGVYPQGDPLAGPPGHPEGFGWNDGMSVNPNNTRLKCAWDDYSCTADPDDTLFFERMVAALRVAGATGHLCEELFPFFLIRFYYPDLYLDTASLTPSW